MQGDEDQELAGKSSGLLKTSELESAYERGRSDERREAWESVKSMIVMGQLQGNGRDKTAERNGIILAANRLADRYLDSERQSGE